jgi:beta-glucanase (GH16 family)
MKHIYIFTIVISILALQLSFAQQMPIDFSDSGDTFTAFGGSGFSTRPNPVDGADTVAQFYNDGSTAWQGFLLNLITPVDLNSQKIITLDFYAFDPNNHVIMVKLENGTNPDVQVTVNDSGSGWENGITFNFADAVLSSDGVTPVIATGSYNRLVIYIDGGTNTPGTYLIDDINDGSTATDPNALDVIYTDLVWSDEFNTAGAYNPVDASNWHHQTLLPGSNGEQFNNESQIYTNRLNNSFVENGALNIVAIKENYTDPNQPNFPKTYTSARLNSKFAFTYGRVDVRAKLPSGNGTWPAIWTLGKNINENGGYWDNQGFGTTPWPACGEIDIMEHGLGAVNHTSSALHTPSSSGNTVNVASQVISDVANNYHIYSLNWSPNQITFLVDEVGYYTYKPSVKDSKTWPFDLDQYILLNIAMGGYAGTIDPSFTQSPMIIDYVRVYQNNALSTYEVGAKNFRVYPNPASDYIKIASTEVIDRLEVYSVLGNLVISKSNSLDRIDVSTINPGIYLLNIYSGSKKITKKVVIN